MTNALERYIDPVFTYRFTQGPDRVPDKVAAQRNGLNCIALAHLAIKDLFGRSLPSSLHCYEMFSDTTRFDTVTSVEDMQAGDLVWFGVRSPKVPLEQYDPQYDEAGALVNWRDNPVKHVAIYTGEQSDGDYVMLHATNVEGTNVLWPLQQFATHRRYEQVYRISRLALSEPL